MSLFLLKSDCTATCNEFFRPPVIRLLPRRCPMIKGWCCCDSFGCEIVAYLLVGETGCEVKMLLIFRRDFLELSPNRSSLSVFGMMRYDSFGISFIFIVSVRAK